jgi:hypothetical protein
MNIRTLYHQNIKDAPALYQVPTGGLYTVFSLCMRFCAISPIRRATRHFASEIEGIRDELVLRWHFDCFSQAYGLAFLRISLRFSFVLLLEHYVTHEDVRDQTSNQLSIAIHQSHLRRLASRLQTGFDLRCFRFLLHFASRPGIRYDYLLEKMKTELLQQGFSEEFPSKLKLERNLAAALENYYRLLLIHCGGRKRSFVWFLQCLPEALEADWAYFIHDHRIARGWRLTEAQGGAVHEIHSLAQIPRNRQLFTPEGYANQIAFFSCFR